MNSQYGLDYICDQDDAADLLLVPLQSESPMVQKVMFEMMAAMSLYKGSSENNLDVGRTLVVETLDMLASSNNQTLALFLLEAITFTESEPFTIAFSTAVFKLINCLILSVPDLAVRKPFRKTFILEGLDLKITNLRKVADSGELTILIL